MFIAITLLRIPNLDDGTFRIIVVVSLYGDIYLGLLYPENRLMQMARILNNHRLFQRGIVTDVQNQDSKIFCNLSEG